MTVYVSMLRGVNVGVAGRLRMDSLREAYESLGLKDVRTVLQSGNVVFSSGVRDRAGLAKRIAQELERRFDLRIEVLLRTAAELRNVIERGPLTGETVDPAKLLVMFLLSVPSAKAQAALARSHKGPEMLEMRGPEIYLYYPDGVGRSRLTGAVIERALDTAGTARNWNTLLELLDAAEKLEATQ
jgi:uncharacterized protein (DUF1697 family)